MIRCAALRRIFCLALLTAGCAERASDAGSAWKGTVDTLSSGALRIVNRGAPIWTDANAWRFGDVLRIGAIEGTGPEVFGDVRDIEVDALGRIYVLEGSTRQVRVFDDAGRHVRSFGRTGDGPGELRQPSALAWVSDTVLLVVDPGGARYSLFDTAGIHLGSVRRDLPNNFFPWRGAVDDSGRVLDWIAARPHHGGAAHQMLVRTSLLAEPASNAPGATHRDTFYLALPAIEQVSVSVPGGGIASTGIPFGPQLRWWIDGRRAEFWTSNSRDYVFTRATFSGDTTLVVEKTHEPVPVPEEDRAAAVKSLAGSQFPIEPAQVPAHMPAVAGFTVDGASFLWVLPAQNGSSAFDVFDARGYFLGRLPAPVPLYTGGGGPPLRVRNHAMYGVTRDSLNVEYVVRMYIVRPQ